MKFNFSNLRVVMFAPTVAQVRQHYKELRGYFCTREYQAAYPQVKLNYLVGPDKDVKPPVEIMLKFYNVAVLSFHFLKI